MAKFAVSYLKEKIKYISVVMAFLIIFSLIMYAFSMPAEAFIYGGIVFLVFLIAFIAVDFNREYKRHMALRILLKSVDENDVELPETAGIIERDYIELIKELKRKITEETSANNIREKDMMDYYTLWVHQIKTPISAMSLMLQNEEIDRTQLKIELFRTEQYAHMALAYLRLESINSDLVFENYGIDNIVRESVRKYAKIFILKKIKMDFIQTDMEEVTDKKWLSFVLEQVLSNSLKYVKAGGTVKIYGGNHVLIVEDNGIGINKEDIPRVFEKGFTGYNGRGDKKSTGLGLYLCRKTMNVLGHRISIDSDEKGTKVILDFTRTKVTFKD